MEPYKPKRNTESNKIKEMIAKKKQQKKLLQENQVSRALLIKYIEGKHFEEILNIFNSSNLEKILWMLFTEDYMQCRVYLLIIQNQCINLLYQINSYIQENLKLTEQFIINLNQEGQKIVYGIMKLINKKIQDSDKINQFTTLLSKLILLNSSLLYFLFKNYFKFELLEKVSKQSQNKIEFITYFDETVAKILSVPKQSQKISEYLVNCKSEMAWSTNQFNLFQENLSIYTLPDLKYNVFHHFATKGDVKSFLLIKEAQNINSSLYNQFNNLEQTPIDQALKHFEIVDLSKLFDLITINTKIKLTVNSINRLIQNRHIKQNEEYLIKFIRFIKSEEMMSRGYIQQIKIAQHFNVSQYFNYQPLLKKIDSQWEYPLLKYINRFDKFENQVIEELAFKELAHYKLSYFNFLKMNEVMRRINYFEIQVDPNELKIFRKDNNYYKIVKQFDVYVKDLYVNALQKNDENLILMLLDRVYHNIFLTHITDGAQLKPHFLQKIIEKKFFKVFSILRENFNSILQYSPNFDESLFVGLGWKSYQHTKDYQMNLTIEIFNRVCWTLRNHYINQKQQQFNLKKQFRKIFLNDTKLYKIKFISQKKIRFVINRISYFLEGHEIQQAYTQFLSDQQQSQHILKSHEAMSQFYDDIFEFNKEAIIFLKSNKPFFSQFVKYGASQIGTNFTYLFEIYFQFEQQLKTIFITQMNQFQPKMLIKWFKQLSHHQHKDKILETVCKFILEKQNIVLIISIINYLYDSVDVENNFKLYKKLITLFQEKIQMIYLEFKNIHKVVIKNQENLIDRIIKLTNLGCNTQIKFSQKLLLKTITDLQKYSSYYEKMIHQMLKTNRTFCEVTLTQNKCTIKQFKSLLKSSKLLTLNYFFFIEKTIINNPHYTFELNRNNFNYSLINQVLNQSFMIGFGNLIQTKLECKNNIFKTFLKYAPKQSLNQYLLEAYEDLMPIQKLKTLQQKIDEEIKIEQSNQYELYKDQFYFQQSMVKRKNLYKNREKKLKEFKSEKSIQWEKDFQIFQDFIKFIEFHKDTIQIATIAKIGMIQFKIIHYLNGLPSTLLNILDKMPAQRVLQIIDYCYVDYRSKQNWRWAQLAVSICQSKPQIYFQTLKIYKQKSRSKVWKYLNQETLKEISKYHPEFAYKQLCQSLQQNQLYRFNEIAQNIRFMKHDLSVYMLLFICSNLPVCTVFQIKNEFYSTIERPEIALSKDHFIQYFNIVIELVKKYKDRYNLNELLKKLIQNVTQKLQQEKLQIIIQSINNNEIDLRNILIEILTKLSQKPTVFTMLQNLYHKNNYQIKYDMTIFQKLKSLILNSQCRKYIQQYPEIKQPEQRYNKFKQLCTTYPNNNVLKELIVTKKFNIKDIKFLFYECNLKKTQSLCSNYNQATISLMIQKNQFIEFLLGLANQDYVAGIMKIFKLYNTLINFKEKNSNILHYICKLKKTRILNQIILYLEQSNLSNILLDLLFQQDQEGNTPFKIAAELNYYQYLFLFRKLAPKESSPIKHCFKPSLRFIVDQEVQYIVKNMDSLKDYINFIFEYSAIVKDSQNEEDQLNLLGKCLKLENA